MNPSPAYVFCIGLNVGASEPADQLNRTLYALQALALVEYLAIGGGTWGGCGERMLQARVKLILHDDADSAARYLAAYLPQECISILNPDGATWRLVGADGKPRDGGTVADWPLLEGIK